MTKPKLSQEFLERLCRCARCPGNPVPKDIAVSPAGESFHGSAQPYVIITAKCHGETDTLRIQENALKVPPLTLPRYMLFKKCHACRGKNGR